MQDDPQQPNKSARTSNHWMPSDARWAVPSLASFNPSQLNGHAPPRRRASLTGPSGEPLYLN